MKFFLRNDYWTNGVNEAVELLRSGSHRHDAIEHAINAIEDEPSITNVGYGGYPNYLGEVELDAAFMDGNDRMLGAIGAIKNFHRPSSIARRLMEEGLHTMLSGKGAETFAHEHGFLEASMLTESVRTHWRNDQNEFLHSGYKPTSTLDAVRHRDAHTDQKNEVKARDTVVAIASDGAGISLSTSTSGWPGKHPGRLGDSPICGAGFYVDSRYGACVCTHTGEMAMRAGTARYLVGQLACGSTIDEAMARAVEDLSTLREGVLDGLVIHAIDSTGILKVVSFNIDTLVKYWWWTEHSDEPKLIEAIPIKLPTSS